MPWRGSGISVASWITGSTSGQREFPDSGSLGPIIPVAFFYVRGGTVDAPHSKCGAAKHASSNLAARSGLSLGRGKCELE